MLHCVAWCIVHFYVVQGMAQCWVRLCSVCHGVIVGQLVLEGVKIHAHICHLVQCGHWQGARVHAIVLTPTGIVACVLTALVCLGWCWQLAVLLAASC